MIGRAWARLVGFGFHLLYHQLAWTYDLVSVVVSLGAWRDWTRTALTHLPPPEAGPLLELAHGTGNLQLDLRARGYWCVGYDLSPQMGRIAGAKLRAAGHALRLLRGRAQALPFAAGTFSAIVCTFPTSFIFEADTLREVARVLRTDAPLVVVLGAQLIGTGPLVQGIEWLYRITGQRKETPQALDAIQAHMATHGLRVQIVQTDVRNSRVLLLVATRM
jgi:ubiquinone/menaquinone biosynthesis C-methylase UbiE